MAQQAHANTNTNRALRTVESGTITQINDLEAGVLETVAINGDLAQLTSAQRVNYYLAMCRMSGTSPVNRPFEYIVLDKKMTLYATRRATDEIRKNSQVTVEIVDRVDDGETYIVTAKATLPNGRTDIATGIVPLLKEEITRWDNNRPIKSGNWIRLNPVERSNAIMKAETKAKRRVTLSAVGLGMLDDSEIETIRGAQRVDVNIETGELLEDTPSGQLPPGVVGSAPKYDDYDAINRAAHGFMDSVGCNHEDLHNAMIALFRGKHQSLKDVPLPHYHDMLEKLKASHDRDPENFQRWIAGLRQSEATDMIDVPASSAPIAAPVEETPELDRATLNKQLHDMSRRFGWSKDTLNAYALHVTGADQIDLSAGGLDQVFKALAATTAIQRSEFADSVMADAPAQQAIPG